MSGAPVRAGAIVGRALTEFGRTAGWALALAALAFGLSWAVDEAIGVAHLRRTHVDFVVVPATWLAGCVVELAAATSIALARLRGERPSAVAAVRAAIRRALTVAVVVVCASIEEVSGVEIGAFGSVVGVTWVASLPAAGAAVAYHAVRSAREAPRAPELERVFG